MALEKILYDSPFRSINKYLAHYHADQSGQFLYYVGCLLFKLHMVFE